MINYYLPIILIVTANTFYHICAKSVPEEANAFVSLLITYLTGALASVIMFFITSQNRQIILEIKELNWAPFVLGISIVALEFGFILLYRVGWNVSIGSLICNIALAVVLIVIGMLIYKEHITANQFVGIIFCICGLIFLNK